jgi:hypothetical protein
MELTPMANEKLTLDREVWNAGFVDGEDGVPVTWCPYPVESTESWSWHSGFIEGAAKRDGFKYSRGTQPRQP